MKNFGLILSLSVLLNVLSLHGAFESRANASDEAQFSQNERPVFQKRKLKVGDRTISVEIADTDERRAYGLMFINKLAADSGMLFVFDDEQMRSFWMQNTFIPLSIEYFSRDKTLNTIVDMQPAVLGTARPKTYSSRTPAMYALEMNIGWFDRNKIRPGVSFKFADK